MIWLIIATLCAFFIKGLCGFANSLIFQAIMGFTADNINISPIELLLSYPSNMIMAWKERKALNWRIWLPLAIMVILGSLPGVFLLKNTDGRIVKIIFGVFIFLIGIEMLLRDKAQKRQQSKLAFFLVGITAGILCGMYGIGILLAAYISRISESSHELKGNLSMVFVVENTFRIALYIATGIITLEAAKSALVLLPFMVLGVVLGIKSSAVLDEKIAKKIVIIMLMISGVAMVAMNI